MTSTEQEPLPDYQSDDEQYQNGGKPINNAQNPQSTYVSIHATGFKDFLLKSELLRGIAEAGFEHPSAVQQECIQNATQGNDLLCQAKSGMGKTAVFVLAVLQRLEKDASPASALVLCHTRELAYQIHQEFKRLGKYLQEIRCKVFYGGEPIEEQRKVLQGKQAPHIIGNIIKY